MAAGLGIKAGKPDQIRKWLRDARIAPAVKQWLKENVDAEIARRGITSGLDDAAVKGTIDTFIDKLLRGTEVMVVQKIATGEAPESGSDGRLEYLLNPDGLPLKQMAPEDRRVVARQVRRVKEGDVLVVCQPAQAGKDGCNVRGEAVPPPHQPLDVPLESIAGTNTQVVGQQVQAGVTGAYRESEDGRVHVVQEIAVVEVNAATGDLPRSGMASASFLIQNGIRNRYGVFTSENVLIGRPNAPAAVDRETRIRARNLFVNGQIAGAQLDPAFLHGEPEKLSEADRRKAELQMANVQIEVAETFGAAEILGRPISAGRILILSQSYMSLLNAQTDVLIDGDLVGGITSFGRRLQVAGNLGNSQNTPTRIRLAVETHADQKKARTEVDLLAQKNRLEEVRRQHENHQRTMESHGKKSEYWAALLSGEKRVPKGPIERRLLEQFFKAVKERNRLAQELAAAQQGVVDMEALAAGADETGEAPSDLTIAVGGRVFPEVLVELATSLNDEDMEQKVTLPGKGGNSTLNMIKQELAQTVKAFVELREEQVAEKKAAIEQMFEGRDDKPPMPEMPNKRFHMSFLFVKEAASTDEPAGKALPMAGTAYVYARNPQQFYLKRTWTVREAMQNVSLLIRRGEAHPEVHVASNETPVVPWHRTAEVLEDMVAVEVLGVNARALLFGK